MKVKLIILCLVLTSVSCKRVSRTERPERPIPVTDTTEPVKPITESGSQNEIIEVEPSQPQDSIAFNARIVRVTDGDTVEALYNGQLQMSVRLAHIDAPEKRGKQPYWQQSKQLLSDLCFGQDVTLVSKLENNGGYETEGRGRMVAVIYNKAGVNVNYQMVKSGLAWHYLEYSDDQRYAEAEIFAKSNKYGLWHDDSPMNPDDFRNRKLD